jgi:hypothetical protein
LTRKVLLIASLALCAFATPSLTSQNSSAASGVSFNQLLEAAKKARDRNSDDEAIRLFRRAAAEQPESEEAL